MVSLCQDCGKRPATHDVSQMGHSRRVCDECYGKGGYAQIHLPGYQAQLRQTPKNLVPPQARKGK
jgi:hypothetical protein